MWYEGQYGDWHWSAKVYDLPSRFGIDEGRVSKLTVKDLGGEVIIHYDRGWDIPPTQSNFQDFQDLVDFIEDSTPVSEEA